MPGYKFKDLNYTVTFPNGSVGYGHRSVKGRGKTLGAGGDALNWVTNTANTFALKRNVDREIGKIYLKIKKLLENHTGVLVVVQYQQWKDGEPGFNPPELLSVMLGPASSNLPSAIRAWENQPKLMQMPTVKGKVLGPRNYLWFIEDKTQKDGLKKTEVMD